MQIDIYIYIYIERERERERNVHFVSIELNIINETVRMDQTLELPTFIIHQIMSYLSAKEVARTRILSKRWNQLNAHSLDNKKFREGLEKIIKFAEATMHRFSKLKFCMQKLRISVSLLGDEESTPLFDESIELAVENGVKSTFGCKLWQPSYAISFRSLKQITLHKVFINDQVVQSLICGCPLLDDLIFRSCFGLKFLSISDAHKLKILTLEELSSEIQSIEIVVPSLQKLALGIFTFGAPPVLNVAECPHLKKLILLVFPLNDREFHHLISKFPLLEDLSIDHCYTLGRIMISSNKLKHLLIFAVDAPCLLSFNFKHNTCPIISTNAPCPWNVSFRCDGVLYTFWFLRLRKFLRASNQIEMLDMYFMSWILFNFDELRRSYPSLPLQIKTMDLHIGLEPSKHEILWDAIFCICCPKNLSFFYMDELKCQFIMWLHGHLQNRNTNCCNDLHIKCWRHYLKDIKVEHFKPFRGCEDNVAELMDRWLLIPEGELWLHLDWCFSELNEKL
ncbi:F-box domain-containing protein [Citrus sinensis]|nr:F-box domain-containing protein [Citrus sinensis]